MSICPSCGRRVPPRVTQCRCGHVFAADTSDEAEAEPVEESRAGARRTWIGPAIAFAAIVIAAAIYMTRSSPVAPPPTAAPRATASPSDVPVSSRPAATAAPTTALPAVETPAPPVALTPSAASFEDIVGAAAAAVVSIETSAGRGSGFFVSPELVITNAHVVESNYSVTLRLSDGTSLPARVLRSSPEVDIAIVRVNEPRPAQATMVMGTVNAARPGQEVIAIGSALGMLQNTVTRGIVSAVRNAGGVILIQTDAAINRGNSGGPLIDRSGRVIGITTLKIASNSESLGFAVAIDHARPLLEGRPAERLAPPTGGAQTTPLSGAFGAAPSQTEAIRAEGAVQYERVMQAAAKRADSIDDDWDNFRRDCRVTVPTTSGDREWFAVWERQPTFNGADPQCVRLIAGITQVAAGVRGAMMSADEAARAASVYPGVRRQLRHKYKMDWDGWDR